MATNRRNVLIMEMYKNKFCVWIINIPEVEAWNWK